MEKQNFMAVSSDFRIPPPVGNDPPDYVVWRTRAGYLLEARGLHSLAEPWQVVSRVGEADDLRNDSCTCRETAKRCEHSCEFVEVHNVSSLPGSKSIVGLEGSVVQLEKVIGQGSLFAPIDLPSMVQDMHSGIGW